MLKSLLKRTNDLSALILRMLLSAVSIQHGPQQVLGRFGRLSVELRWEDSRAKSQAVEVPGDGLKLSEAILESHTMTTLRCLPLSWGFGVCPASWRVLARQSINGSQAEGALAQPIFDFAPKAPHVLALSSTVSSMMCLSRNPAIWSP